MSDSLKHECGIALLRLRKPLTYYAETYGSQFYGLDKLLLLMEKQHNRGQDGAGVAVIKNDPEPGQPYIFRERMDGNNAIPQVFGAIRKQIETRSPEEAMPFLGELLLGHLRYATHGSRGPAYCHPFIRQNNWMSKNLVMAGNFNLTNSRELFEELIALGQHPRNQTDTVTVMERIGHSLDVAVDALSVDFLRFGGSPAGMQHYLAARLDVAAVLRDAVTAFDGGYVMAGMLGCGDTFVLRDPNGIRPAFWYADDEVVVVTSERPQIQTAFGAKRGSVQEIEPGCALIVRADGSFTHERILPAGPKTACSFERIYFSRGTDADIYQERKSLGRELAQPVLEAVGTDIKNTIFSFIPNTAEVAFLGLLEGIEDWRSADLTAKIGAGEEPETALKNYLDSRPRIERIAVKDAKLRTFISSDDSRADLVSHVYDTTYGLVKNGEDTLVILDDSIVRGTTLRNSILQILDRLSPKRIIVVSSAPQIRYPDCYGIDMSRLADFVAFRAAVSLLQRDGKEDLLNQVYADCQRDSDLPSPTNHVKRIYSQYTDMDISKEIARLLRANTLKAEVEVIYQTVEGLAKACPLHKGRWYFTGDYPTPGGNKVANRSFVLYMENKAGRAY